MCYSFSGILEDYELDVLILIEFACRSYDVFAYVFSWKFLFGTAQQTNGKTST
jgi:hypothetical protein